MQLEYRALRVSVASAQPAGRQGRGGPARRRAALVCRLPQDPQRRRLPVTKFIKASYPGWPAGARRWSLQVRLATLWQSSSSVAVREPQSSQSPPPRRWRR